APVVEGDHRVLAGQSRHEVGMPGRAVVSGTGDKQQRAPAALHLIVDLGVLIVNGRHRYPFRPTKSATPRLNSAAGSMGIRCEAPSIRWISRSGSAASYAAACVAGPIGSAAPAMNNTGQVMCGSWSAKLRSALARDRAARTAGASCRTPA